jgi:hypothetical protein
MVAHESAHDRIWEQWEMAREREDHRLLQELELYCDGIAILTLRRLGIKVSKWMTGLEKMHRFNRQRFGLTFAIPRWPTAKSSPRRLSRGLPRRTE